MSKKSVRVEMPMSLYQRLADQSDGEGEAMSSIIRRAVDEYLGRFEVPSGPKLGRRDLAEPPLKVT